MIMMRIRAQGRWILANGLAFRRLINRRNTLCLSLTGILLSVWMPLVQGQARANWVNEPVQPLTTASVESPQVVALGERLFNDPIMSRNKDVACATCHILALGGDDDRALSVGTDGGRSEFNSPTVFNVGLNFRQFWDGRAASLEEQVDFPLTHPNEMATNWEELLSRLRKHPDYPALFKEAFGEEISPQRVRTSLAEFQRTLVTTDAPFDRWLKGDESAVSELAKHGYQRFKELGCASCHQGQGVGGNMYAPLGVIVEGMCAEEAVREADLGRFRITGDEQDRCLFKVPSLRNVAVTGPYFHDGSVRSLEAAILLMGHYQLGRRISAEDTEALVAFLKSLTGNWRGQSLDPQMADSGRPSS